MKDIVICNIDKHNIDCFAQYIPKDLLNSSLDNIIALGCICFGYSCAVLICLKEPYRQYHILHMFVDEKVRKIGLEQYILKVLISELKKNDAEFLYFCCPDIDLNPKENAEKIFKDVGFNQRINGQAYTFKFRELKNSHFLPDCNQNNNIVRFSKLSGPQVYNYKLNIETNKIPRAFGIDAAKGEIIDELTLAAVKNESVVGILVVSKIHDIVVLSSLYTVEGNHNVFLPLLKTAMKEAKNILNDDQIIKVLAVNKISKHLCERYLKHLEFSSETEYIFEYNFQYRLAKK